MKRSEINGAIKNALELFKEYKISLPPFVLWSADDWKTKGEEADEIRDNMLGWDITDFGKGNFELLEGKRLFSQVKGEERGRSEVPFH